MTNDVVRTKGKETAEEIRKLGEKAKATGLDLGQYADDVARAVEEASDRVASAVEDYLKQADLSKKSITDQGTAMADIPKREPSQPKEVKTLPRTNSSRPTREQGIEAVGHALGAMSRPPATE